MVRDLTWANDTGVITLASYSGEERLAVHRSQAG